MLGILNEAKKRRSDLDANNENQVRQPPAQDHDVGSRPDAEQTRWRFGAYDSRHRVYNASVRRIRWGVCARVATGWILSRPTINDSLAFR